MRIQIVPTIKMKYSDYKSANSAQGAKNKTIIQDLSVKCPNNSFARSQIAMSQHGRCRPRKCMMCEYCGGFDVKMKRTLLMRVIVVRK